MRLLILILSLLTIIGTKAENTGNLIGDDLECAFLNCQYNYPNIHMHKSFIHDDPYIYSGSTDPYLNYAITTHNVNLDTQKFEMQQVNYGYKYKAYANGVVEIAIGVFKDGDTLSYDNFIDDQIHTYQVSADGNTWTSIDHTYSDMTVLKDADIIAMGIRGVSDRSTSSCTYCGSDDILFDDIYLNYDYKEIPLDLVSPTSPTKQAIYEPIIEPEIKLEPEPMQTDVAVAPTPQPTVQQPKPQVQAKPKQTKTVKKQTKEVKQDVKPREKPKSTTTKLADAMQTTSLVTLANNTNHNSLFNSSPVGFESYMGLQLVEAINFVEPLFYEEPEFYDSEINLTDTIIINDSINIQQGTWYGNNPKFY